MSVFETRSLISDVIPVDERQIHEAQKRKRTRCKSK